MIFGPKHKPSGLHLYQAIMPFGDHLEELRRRLILSLLGLVPLFVGSLAASGPLLRFIVEPVRDALRAHQLPAAMQAVAAQEGFMTAMYLAVVLTIVAGSPWILYQAWRFVAPGLYENERRFVYVLLPLSAVLTVIGMVLLYTTIMPPVLGFLIRFSSMLGETPVSSSVLAEGTVLGHMPALEADPIAPAPGDCWVNRELMELRICVGEEGGKMTIVSAPLSKSAGLLQQFRLTDYVNLFLGFALAFAVGFQTPVVVLLLGWVGLIDRATLAKYRKHVVFVSFIASASLTPGADPVSMIVLGVVLVLLFELGGLLLWLLPAKRVAGKAPDAGDGGGEGPDDDRA